MATIAIIFKGNDESGSAFNSVTNGLEKIDKAAERVTNQFVGVHNSFNTFVGQADNVRGGFDRINNAADNAIRGFSNLALAGAAAGLSLATDFVGSSIKSYTEFEGKLKEVEAVSDGVTKQQMQQMKDLALTMGKTLPISAKDAADSFVELAKSGFTADEIINEFGNSLAYLATAGGLSMEKASAILGMALKDFHLDATQGTHAADILAKTANMSALGISDLGETLKYVGPVAHAAGMNLEDVSIAAGVMGNSGIKASMAGTSLRSIITRLIDPPKDAARELEKLGFSIQNADGTVKPLGQTIKELREKFKGLSEAEAVAAATAIAGKPAMAGMLSLIQASDADFDKMTEAIYNADGAAKKMSDTMMDSSKGSFEQLKGSVETLQIAFADKFASALGDVLKVLTQLVNDSIPVAEFLGGALAQGINLAVQAFQFLFSEGSKVGNDMMPEIIKAINLGIQIFQLFAPMVVDAAVSFWNGLQPVFQSVGEMFNSFWNLVQEIFGVLVVFFTENGTSIMQTVSQVWNTIVLVVQTAVQTISDIVTTIFGAITGFIQQHSLEIQTFFTQAWTGIKDIIQIIIQAINDFVIPVLQGIGDFIQQNQQTIQDIITVVWNVISTTIMTIINTIKVILETVFNAIRDFISQHGETIKQTAQQVWEFIKNAVTTAINVVRDVVTNVSNAIKDFWSQHGEQIKTSAKAAWDFINDAIKNIINTVRDVITNIANGIKDFWDKHGEDIKRIAKAAWDFISTTVKDIINAIKDVITNTANTIKDFWDNHGQQIMTIASNAWNAISTTVGTAIGIIGDVIGGFISAITMAWDTFGSTIMNAAKNTWDTISTLVKGVIDTISHVIGGFIDLISGDWDGFLKEMGSAWDSAWNGIVGGIGKFIDNIKNTIQGLIEGVISKFKGVDWGSIGSNMIQGVISGVGSMGGALTNAVLNIVKNAFGALLGFLGIGSPSRLFAEKIGLPIVQGMAVGIDEGSGLVTSALGQVATQAIQTTSSIVNNSNSAVTNNYYQLTANYAYQERTSVASDLRLMQMLGSKT